MVTCSSCGQESPEGFAFCPACGAPLEQTTPSRDVRKTVTVVFSDVTGSTALGEQLDPESLRRVMARYFDEMQTVVQHHDGTVEKFIGDAVMAVFGIPVLHEDDALRAVRAASEMRERLGELNEELQQAWGVRIQVRTGINTGEVVAGDASSSQRFATGDTVNVAKRFEEAAGPGEVLVGEQTYRLVRDAVEVEPVEPLELKGKRKPVPAYRLLSLEAGAPGRARRLDSPMVGRDRERAALDQAYERAVGERACHLFTVLGSAGVGKSRLLADFLGGLGDAATVVGGRCLPYGDGITFWPLLEVIRSLYGEEFVPAIAEQLAGDENAQLIADRLGAALGLGENAGSADETFWAVRKLFEAQARDQPFVVVFDDLQWASPVFLDLVEHVSDWSRDAPILLVCLARPELLELRPGWSGGKFNAVSVLLEPLSEDESAELVRNLLGAAQLDEDVRTRVTAAAEGNPLFVEEMLAMLIDDGLLERSNGDWVPVTDLRSVTVPATIQALLSARLDQLLPSERAVMERASVEGKVFHRGAVAELSPTDARAEVAAHLQALVRKELVRPDQAEFAGDDAFRFRHLLIRDAAYDAMPKELRAELHERFAEWLEGVAGDRFLEYEEILGFHLEQAYRYRRELAPLDEAGQALGTRAGARLASAGERAFAHNDGPAAISLLDRALELLPEDSPMRSTLQSDLGLALTDRGEFARAEAALSEATTAARALDQPAVEAVATNRSIWVRLLTSRGGVEDARTEVEKSVHALEQFQDEKGLAEAYSLLGTLLAWSGRCAEAAEVFERSVALSRKAGAEKVASRSLTWLLIVAIWGPMTVAEALVLCDRVVEETGDRYIECFGGLVKGVLLTMADDWEKGPVLIDTGREALEEFGQRVTAASTRMASARNKFHAGHVEEAEADLRLGHDVLERLGERGYLSTISAILAIVLCAQGRYDEAERYVEKARELVAEDDLTTAVYWRCAQAQILASRDEIDDARRVVDEADAIMARTDYTADQAEALLARAAVEKRAGERDQSMAALERALELFEQKGYVVAAAHTRRLISEA
jgi:class 3 adenylate cyclase/tetratricopeptide (TPR) repeat protein